MTAIVDLPNVPKFTIKAVASQTGISPVTLRAWERRHEVLIPHRMENHYRLYSERDIAILRWLKYRVDEGMPISSAVNELRKMASSNIWPEVGPLLPEPSTGFVGIPAAQYARQLAQVLIQHDENRAGNLFREVHSRFDLLTVILEVIAPAIKRIEKAWYVSEINTSARRFATSYLRGKLLALLQAYPSRNSAPLISLGCAPMEVNELDSLMMAVLLRSQGFRVDYLGPDINLEDLADYVNYELPAMVILWANSDFTAREMRPMQGFLKKGRTATLFSFAGEAFTQQPQLRQNIPGIYLGEKMDAMLEQVKTLLKSPHRSRK